jgi:hypothetical protein
MAKLLSQKDYTPEELKIFVKAMYAQHNYTHDHVHMHPYTLTHIHDIMHMHAHSSTKEKVEGIPDDESPNELVYADCES